MEDNDKNFDAMMSTLFECADMNTEDLEEFADSYLDKLRADAERWRKVVALAADCGPLDSTTNLIDFGDRVQDLIKDTPHA